MRSRRLLTCADGWKVNVNFASGGPGSENDGGVGLPVVGACWGFNLVVAVAGRVVLLAWHRRRPVNLPGGQAAVALVDAESDIRRLTPRQNHW